jgi:hypothetical protein
MSASASSRVLLAAALAALALGCGEPAQYRFGVNLSGLVLGPVSATEGIYPDISVLRDPANPFARYPMGSDDAGIATKWRVLNGGTSGVGLGPVAGFYAFATALAGEPTGENQYYTAKMLDQVYRSGAVADPGASPVSTLLPDGGSLVKEMAIEAYQRTLDAFPNGISYLDASATTYFRTATPAYLGIVGLGGRVKGSWSLVATTTDPLHPGTGPVEAVLLTTNP